ncbi:MAG: c-type cytochrome [Candidatus Binatus sp.]
MAAHTPGPFKLHNPWLRIGWLSAAGLLGVSIFLGFVLLGSSQQNGQPRSAWSAFCSALGISPDIGPADEPQPPLRTPSRIAWTRETLAQIADGNAKQGAFVAMNCTACHGEQGVSSSGLYPTLAGMDAAAIYKQLDDYRADKRSWGAMNGIAQALSQQASADVAAYYASDAKVLAAANKKDPPAQGTPATRLVYDGDPSRGIPPCAACHGPNEIKLGAPALKGQQPTYTERQLAEFAQGMRQNDIDERMRTIASQLTPIEMHNLAEFYAADSDEKRAGR